MPTGALTRSQFDVNCIRKHRLTPGRVHPHQAVALPVPPPRPRRRRRFWILVGLFLTVLCLMIVQMNGLSIIAQKYLVAGLNAGAVKG